MAHISTAARKFRKDTRLAISSYMKSMTYKEDKWEFLNPVTNKTETLNALGVEGMLYSMVPAAREADYKYGRGVARLFLNQAEVQSNYRNASALNDIIKIITSAHVHEWDSDLRGFSVRELTDFFHNETKLLNDGDREEISKMELVPNPSYKAIQIKDFEQAQLYKDYTSWCITTSESMWNQYSANGLNNVYFLTKEGFEELKEIKDSPTDEYGVSLISIIVRPFGSIAFCTGRYNHGLGGNDSLLSAKEISELIGRNFYEVFLPKSPEEVEKIIFASWKEAEPDQACKKQGWKRLCKTEEKYWGTPKTTYTYYDIEKKYLVFDEVGEYDRNGLSIVKLNNKYSIINRDGDFVV